MRKLLVALALLLPVHSTAATLDSADCRDAARAGWNHPGKNNACLMTLLEDLFGSGWESRDF